MFRYTVHPRSLCRGVGAVVLVGAAAGLIGLAGAGSASASPDTRYVPIAPSIKLDSVALNPQPLPPGPPELRRVLQLPRLGF